VIVTAPGVLGRARDVVAPELERRLATLAPPMSIVAAYHLGLQDRDGRPAAGNGGKSVRPALAVLSAEAVGSALDVALPGAVAVELVHNFSLLHDDVMDRDRERRHRPTAWAVFGEPAAILAGDALLVLAQRTVLEQASPARVAAAADALSVASARMIAGQAEDVAFEADDSVSVDRCLRMMADKTGALLSCAASIGAILADAPERQVDALARFGAHVGLAFQAVDDLLGIWGDPDVTGKPAANDLRERKKSLPVAAALEADGPGGRKLRSLLTGESLGGQEVAEAARLIEHLGGRDRTRRIAERELARCVEALQDASLVEPARSELEELSRFVVEREF
jgi:geranylgeranyl diphosphate synthase type I